MSASEDLPVLTREDLTRLQAQFPPRCLGIRETVEDHLRYAGKVELIEALVRRREDILKSPESTDLGDDLTYEDLGPDEDDLIGLTEGENAASA
jgi:hypothetical protein